MDGREYNGPIDISCPSSIVKKVDLASLDLYLQARQRAKIETTNSMEIFS